MALEAALQDWLKGQGLRLETSSEHGRTVVADRPFRTGEVLLSQQPYSWVIADDKRLSCCDFCCQNSERGLLRCSRCRVSRYCSQACQRKAWALHQHECQQQNRTLTATLRLVRRMLLKRRQEKGLRTPAIDSFELITSLVSHMKDFPEEKLLLHAQMATLIQSSLGEEASEKEGFSVREITELLCRVSCNAHSISDAEIRPIGMALFPGISLVNHSCLPNTTLAFSLKPAGAPCGELRATEPIAPGDQISFSYTDVAAPTATRQANLQNQYYFNCGCRRCALSKTRDGMIEDAALGGACCASCEGVLLSECGQEVCQGCGKGYDMVTVDLAIKNVTEIGAAGSALQKEGQLEAARSALIGVENAQAKVLHRHNVELMRTRDELMRLCLDLQDWSSAAKYCRLTLPAYERAYPPHSPLLGLQYAALGKLEWFLERPHQTAEALRKALQVLTVTHRSSHPLVVELSSLLGQAESELRSSMLEDGE